MQAAPVRFAQPSVVVSRSVVFAFNPDQPRDEHGRWSGGASAADRQPMSSHEEWRASLSKPEVKALDAWISTSGTWKSMREAEVNGQRGEQLDAFHTAIDRAPSYQGQVMRGLKGLSQKDITALASAKDITFNASSSASKSGIYAAKTFAGGRGGVLLRIEQHSGSDISQLHADKNAEGEVILHQGTTYEITGRSTFTVGGKTVPVIHMREK